jgi:hypothetical protein
LPTILPRRIGADIRKRTEWWAGGFGVLRAVFVVLINLHRNLRRLVIGDRPALRTLASNLNRPAIDGVNDLCIPYWHDGE